MGFPEKTTQKSEDVEMKDITVPVNKNKSLKDTKIKNKNSKKSKSETKMATNDIKVNDKSEDSEQKPKRQRKRKENKAPIRNIAEEIKSKLHSRTNKKITTAINNIANDENLNFRSLLNIYKSTVDEEKRLYIIKRIIRGCSSVDEKIARKFFICFTKLVKKIDNESDVKYATNEIDSIFFKSDKDNNNTRTENKAVKHASIEIANLLLNNPEFYNKFTPDQINKYFSYILQLWDNKSVNLACQACWTFGSFLRQCSKEDFQHFHALIDTNMLKLNDLEKPQVLFIILNLTKDQKDVLKKSTAKSVPVVNDPVHFKKWADHIKSCDESVSSKLFDLAMGHEKFAKIWNSILKLCKTDVRFHEIVISRACDILTFGKSSVLYKFGADKHLKILNKVWDDAELISWTLKQLSQINVKCHQTAKSCVEKLREILARKEDLEHLKPVLVKFFELLAVKHCKITLQHELTTKKVLRITNMLAEGLELNKEHFDSIIEHSIALYGKSEKDMERKQICSYMMSFFHYSKIKDFRILRFLCQENYQKSINNDSDDEINEELLKCLENLSEEESMELIKLTLTDNSDLGENLKDLIEKLNEFYLEKTCQEKSKKRKRSSLTMTTEKAHQFKAMYKLLIDKLYLYTVCVKYDGDSLDLINDVLLSYKEAISKSSIESSKRLKTGDGESKEVKVLDEMKWKMVLFDTLLVLMEQKCRFFRSLVVNVFGEMISLDLVDLEVLNKIKELLNDLKNEKLKAFQNKKKVEEMDIDEESDEEDNESDEEVDESDEEEALERKLESQGKIDVSMKIFKALAKSGDLCKDEDDADEDGIEEKEDIEESEGDDIEVGEKKKTKRDKMKRVTDLNHLRNKCLDLLNMMVLKCDNVELKVEAICSLIGVFRQRGEGELIDRTISLSKSLRESKLVWKDERTVEWIQKILESLVGKNISTELCDLLKLIVDCVLKECILDESGKSSLKELLQTIMKDTKLSKGLTIIVKHLENTYLAGETSVNDEAQIKQLIESADEMSWNQLSKKLDLFVNSISNKSSNEITPGQIALVEFIQSRIEKLEFKNNMSQTSVLLNALVLIMKSHITSKSLLDTINKQTFIDKVKSACKLTKHIKASATKFLNALNNLKNVQ